MGTWRVEQEQVGILNLEGGARTGWNMDIKRVYVARTVWNMDIKRVYVARTVWNMDIKRVYVARTADEI